MTMFYAKKHSGGASSAPPRSKSPNIDVDERPMHGCFPVSSQAPHKELIPGLSVHSIDNAINNGCIAIVQEFMDVFAQTLIRMAMGIPG